MRLVQAGGMTGIESIPLGVFGLNSNTIATEVYVYYISLLKLCI